VPRTERSAAQPSLQGGARPIIEAGAQIFQPRFTGEVRLVLWSFLKAAELAAKTWGDRQPFRVNSRSLFIALSDF